ncbi:cytochrome P450 [Nocardioides pacificus]
MTELVTRVLNDHRMVGVGPVEEGNDRFDRLRSDGPIAWVEEPDRSYWMVLDHELTRRCLQDPGTFSSSVVTPLNPDPSFAMIPIQLDAPEHTPWRQLLARYFAPRRMTELRPRLEERCRDLVLQVRSTGSGDLLKDIGLQFPTVVFLELMGLPVDRLPQFLEWESAALAPGAEGEFDAESQMMAMLSVVGYFQEEIERRRREGDRPEGLLSDMLSWEIDGVPAPDDSLVNCCMLLFLAGLDTVAMSLSFMMHHLATHAEDRAHVASIASDGEPMGDVVEELLRYYTVPEVGRKVTQDVEVGGALLKAGDLVLFPLMSANRDEAWLTGADRVDLDRGQVAPHLAFGAGPHRCLGSHLARIELDIALTEWHRAIPDYGLDPAWEPQAYWGNVHGMFALPLVVKGGAPS